MVNLTMFLENNEFSALEVRVKIIENIIKYQILLVSYRIFQYQMLVWGEFGFTPAPILHFSHFRVPAIEAEHLVHAQCTGVHGAGVALNFGARFFEIQLLCCFKCFKANETISLFLNHAHRDSHTPTQQIHIFKNTSTNMSVFGWKILAETGR